MYIGYMLYNEGSLYNNIREKNKTDTIVSTFVLFSADATCFGPYIGPSSGVK
jgi:hypothetical protein